MKPPRSALAFLAIGLLAASQSGNIIRIGDAPPVVMAAWRLLLASLVLLALAGKGLGMLTRLRRTEWALLCLAGTALAAHLIAWIAAVQWTTVANAAVFFAVNPVLTAIGAFVIYRERIGGRLLLAIGLGIFGVGLIFRHDLSFGNEHLAGDGMALLCSLFFTLYFLVGKRLRQVLPTRVYVASIYAVAGLVSLGVALAFGLPLFGYSAQTTLTFFLLALIPTLIGHTSFNHALKFMPAGWISAATLSEPPLAGLVAAWAWGEIPGPAMIVGYGIIALAVLVLVVDQTRRRQEALP